MSFEKVSIFFPNLFEARMSENGNRIYRFKSFLLNVGERRLFDGVREIHLTPKTFDVLVHLVENAGRLVHKDDLMQAVWPDCFVEEVNIPRSVHHLRRTLGQDDNGNRFIETVPTKGYRFIVPVLNGELDIPATPVPELESIALDLKPSASLVRSVATPVETGARHEQAASATSGILHRPILVAGLVIGLLILIGGAFWGGRAPVLEGGQTNELALVTNNSRAYQLYQEGKFILDRRHPGHGEAALAKFEEAIELDPNFSLAYSGKADAEWRIFNPTRIPDTIARARASVNKALSLDPNSSYAHTMLCRLYATYDWDFPAAEKACRRAVELDPKNYDAHFELAMFLTSFGRQDEALAEIDTAVEIAPTSSNRNNRAIILFHARRYDEAIAELKQILKDDPEFPPAWHWQWWNYAMNQEYDKALEAYFDFQKFRGQAVSEDDLRSIYSTQGFSGVQRAIVQEYKPGDIGGIPIAALHCQLGDLDRTFEILESELQRRTLWTVHLKVDPRFDRCRNDPRFDGILKRIGLN